MLFVISIFIILQQFNYAYNKFWSQRVHVFTSQALFNPYPAELNNLNFHPLEVVSRYRDLQLQVAEHYWYLFNLTPNIWKCWCLITHFFPNNCDLISE